MKDAGWTSVLDPTSFPSDKKGEEAITTFIQANLDRHAYLQLVEGKDLWGPSSVYYIDAFITPGDLTLMEQPLDDIWVAEGLPNIIDSWTFPWRAPKKLLRKIFSENQEKIVELVDKYQKDEKALKTKLAKDMLDLESQESQIKKTAQKYGLEL